MASASLHPLFMSEKDAKDVAQLLRNWSETIIDWSANSNQYRTFEFEFISILLAAYGSQKRRNFRLIGDICIFGSSCQDTLFCLL